MEGRLQNEFQKICKLHTPERGKNTEGGMVKTTHTHTTRVRALETNNE